MKKHSGPASPTWAYSYELLPPQPPGRLRPIKAVLEEEAALAKLRSQTWQARLVRDSNVSHILIVADTPDQRREVNRRIEAELGALPADFLVTVPMMVAEGGEAPPGSERRRPADPIPPTK